MDRRAILSSRASTRKSTPYSDKTSQYSRNLTPEIDISDISDKKYEDIKQAFELCANADKNKLHGLSNRTDDNDVIITRDIRMVMEKLGFQMTEAEIGMFVKNLKATGYYSLIDFIQMSQRADFQTGDEKQDRNELWEAFKFFDRNGDGHISVCDLQETLNLLGLKFSPTEIYQMVSGANTNGEGRISLNDFETMLQDDVMNMK